MTVQHLTIDQITSYIDGDATEDERIAVTAHADICEVCQSDLSSMTLIKNAYGALGEIEVPRSFTLTPADVTPLASPGLVTPIRPKVGRWEQVARFVAIAAAIAFIALGAGQLTGILDTADNSSPTQIAMDSETNDDAAALNEQEPAPALARGEVRESGESAAVGASALQAELARVDTPAQAESNSLTPLEITTIGLGFVALAAIAAWILIHYRAGSTS